MFSLRKRFSASLFLVASFATCLTALPTVPAYAQTSTAATSAHVAYVYVGTTKGVYLYDAASNGTLTLVSGSPFSVSGLAVGSNGKYFVSLGTDYVHSYIVGSNGAIQGPASQINTQSYSGSTCGTTSGAVFDHTGQDLYVQLNNGQNECTALQSFKISSTGGLTFLGSTEFNQSFTSTPTRIALTGNDAFGYSFAGIGFCSSNAYEFQRESSGAMMLGTTFSSLTTPPPSGDFQPLVGTGDPTNHLVIAGSEETDYCTFNPPQLASYTVASNGDITSTNTTANMPTPLVNPTVLNMSPSGQFLAVGGNTTPPISGTQHPGLQIFHFNGASPITADSGTLTTTPIDEVHWDNSNHLYALSNSAKKLYVYTVTSSSITAVPGSPFTIAATPNALAVVPTSTACNAPSAAGVHICAPASGSSLSSPVSVQAAATITGTISNMQLWVDGVKKFTESGSKTLSTSVGLAAGTHRFAVLAINTTGQKWESTVSANVN